MSNYHSNTTPSGQLSLASLNQKSKSVEDNPILQRWARQGIQSAKEDYFNLLFSNLQLWLAPTVKRLESGLNVLETSQDSIKLKKIREALIHNIEDESGNGNPKEAHAKLFLNSVEQISSTLFGHSRKKAKILPATKTLEKVSRELFSQDLYVMLGACLAQEARALPQLAHLQMGCQIQQSVFSADEWNQVNKFYEIHLDGTEARHAEDLNQTLSHVLDSREKEEAFLYGFDSLLNLLEDFWSQLRSELQHLA